MSDSSSSLIKPSSNGKKPYSDFSILSPLFKEPFKKGWKREVVYRAIVGNERRNMCDIYYFAPDGKKLRSGREVADYLKQTKSSFTLENFTFFREPIGMDVKYEVIRLARLRTCQDEETSKNTFPRNYGTVRTRPKRVLKLSGESDEEEALTWKESTSKSSAPVIDGDKTPSKRNHTRTRLRNSSTSIPKTLHSSEITLTLPNSSCKSDSGYTSGQKSPEMLREPEPHSLPLITLLPCGTTLVISDSETLTISSSNINSSITPVRRRETISPKVSLPPIPDLPEVTDLSSVASLSPNAATSLNCSKFEKCTKSIPGSPPIRRILLPKTDGFAVPRFLPAYEGQVSLAPFGTVYRKRSYWESIGQTIIEEGLQRAMLSHPCRSSGTIEEHPVRATRKKSVPKRFQDAVGPSSPAPAIRLTCKDYFALRKQLRQQLLFNQPSVNGSSITSNLSPTITSSHVSNSSTKKMSS
ncbi:hypothetical protein GHT06_019645 [Daphnia sinensis]|uniref:MBD domain-containing protein n=1 Tax=Daphnia sinensis TaxID=1820382 RepID=A0AAD5LB19_9CRUS|nr:hypothetical protein GHT06_019645 [Daphnia sinensis]